MIFAETFHTGTVHHWHSQGKRQFPLLTPQCHFMIFCLPSPHFFSFLAMEMKPNPIENRLTRQDVAAHLGCSVSSVIRYEEKELLKSHRVGPRLIRFWPADVVAFESAKKWSTSTKHPRSSLRAAKSTSFQAKKDQNPSGKTSIPATGDARVEGLTFWRTGIEGSL